MTITNVKTSKIKWKKKEKNEISRSEKEEKEKGKENKKKIKIKFKNYKEKIWRRNYILSFNVDVGQVTNWNMKKWIVIKSDQDVYTPNLS